MTIFVLYRKYAWLKKKTAAATILFPQNEKTRRQHLLVGFMSFSFHTTHHCFYPIPKRKEFLLESTIEFVL